MTAYQIAKIFLIGIALVCAVSIFAIRVRRLVGLMTAVRGKTAVRRDHVRERLRVFLTDVLGQSNVRRKKGPGIAHMLIFFGFLAVQPHSLELMIQGVWPAFHAGRLAPALYRGYLFSADILAFLVLLGLAYALFRRMLVRPPYLTDGTDARLILLFTSVIIVSFHFVNAFGLLRPGDGVDLAGALPVSSQLIPLLDLDRFGEAGRSAGYEAAYWVHILTILGFLVYIPGSKHLHLLAAVPNVCLKPLAREKAMIVTDIEDENAESFGLGAVTDLNWKNVLDLYACTECGRCEEQCPAAQTGKALSPKAVVSDIKHDLFDQADALLAGYTGEIRPLVREGSPVTNEVLFACTTCRACEDICPVNIAHLDLILEARKHRVLMEADFPPELQETFTNLENQSNPWGFAADSRADWRRGLDIPLVTDRPEAELLWFVGCAGSFDDRGKKISRALARVLLRAGVGVAVLGAEERCNGDTARRCGNEYLARMMIAENVETLNRYRPKRILTACPHCYNTIRNEYPQFGARYDVVHHSELLQELLGEGRLRVNRRVAGATAWHDSCYLGRWNGITAAPRRVLEVVQGAGALKEPRRSGGRGFCCGAGGGRMFMEETAGRRINIARAEELLALRAATIAAACPFCITMLSDAVADRGGNAAVKDIAEIVDEATA